MPHPQLQWDMGPLFRTFELDDNLSSWEPLGQVVSGQEFDFPTSRKRMHLMP